MRKRFLYYAVHWHTFRTLVGALLGLLFALAMFGLYQQEQACGNGRPGCYGISLRVHPEDRLYPQADGLNPNIVVVGIDDASVRELNQYPFTRDKYAVLLDNLARAGAAVVVFDVGFTEDRQGGGDALFQKALAGDKVPVVLAVGQCDGCTRYAANRLQLINLDQVPLRKFRCLDENSAAPLSPCSRPMKNVELGSTAVITGNDGVMRTLPMFVEPACTAERTCDLPLLSPVSFVAYRDYLLGDAAPEAELELAGAHQATFGQAWSRPLWVDDSGMAIVNWTAAPGAVKEQGRYLSFKDVFRGEVPADRLSGKIVLVGAYGLTGFHDAQLVPTGGGEFMNGVEIHANVLSELLAPQQRKFTYPEPDWLLVASLLVLSIGMGLLLSRLSVLKGLAASAGMLVLYTAPWLVLQNIPVPDLVHPWLGIALTYSGLTAYRLLYEDREKRKVTAIFGQYLKPEIVNQLAAKRSLDDIALGGERRDLSLLFVDIRGFTRMSEAMAAEDVLKVLDEYLDQLTGIVFNWDGTLDKYVGDEIIAVWNAVDPQPDHPLLAVRCAYEMLSRRTELNARLEARGLPPISYGIGVNTGPAVWGNMGSRFRHQFTAIGDTVNTAARFCSAAGQYELLIGEQTYQRCRDYLKAEAAPGIELKGKSAATYRIYRALAIRPDTRSPWIDLPGSDLTAKPEEPAPVRTRPEPAKRA